MAKTKGKKESSGGKKERSPKQKAAQRKAVAAAKRARGGGKRHASSGGGKKKKHRKGGAKKKRRSGGGTTIARSNPASTKAPVMGLKQFLVAALKVGGMATLGFIGGEMLRRYMLSPKKDGSASTLASFEAKHGTSPAVSALITGLPGLLGGGTAYWLGKRFNAPMLRMAGGALAIGGVVSGGSRLLLGNTFVAQKTGGLFLVQGASPAAPGNQLMAPAAAPAPGTPAQQPGAGYGYTQPPAWRQLGDAFTSAPYGDQWTGNPYGRAPMGDAFVADPGGDYVTRVGDRPRGAAGFGITAAEELGE